MSFFFELFARIVSLPSELWKQSNENSGIGASEFEHNAERFWGKVALIAGVCGAIIYAIWKWVTG